MSARNSSAWMQWQEPGFTLMELLVTIAVLLVTTLIVIPNLSSFRMQANENSAIQALRGVYQAESQYESMYPTRGFACSLAALGGMPGAPPSPEGAHVLDREVASGHKSGYKFSIAHCTHSLAVGAPSTNIGFEVTAVPQQAGRTGHRSFCVDERGEIKFDPTGGSNCTETLP